MNIMMILKMLTVKVAEQIFINIVEIVKKHKVKAYFAWNVKDVI